MKKPSLAPTYEVGQRIDLYEFITDDGELVGCKAGTVRPGVREFEVSNLVQVYFTKYTEINKGFPFWCNSEVKPQQVRKVGSVTIKSLKQC